MNLYFKLKEDIYFKFLLILFQIINKATSPSSSYAQLHPSSSVSLNPTTGLFRKGHHQSASIGSFSSSDSSCSIQSKANPSALSPR